MAGRKYHLEIVCELDTLVCQLPQSRSKSHAMVTYAVLVLLLPVHQKAACVGIR